MVFEFSHAQTNLSLDGLMNLIKIDPKKALGLANLETKLYHFNVSSSGTWKGWT